MSADDTPSGRRVALREDVRLSGPRYRGPKTVRIVHDAASGRCYELGAKEAFLAEQLRAPADHASVEPGFVQAFGRPLSPAGWGRFLGLLQARGLLVATDGLPASTATSAEPAAVRTSDLRAGRWVVAPVSELVARLHRHLRLLFSPWAVGLSGLLAGAMLFWLARIVGTDRQALNPLTDWRVAVGVGVLSWVSLSLHELGHGLAAHHLGGRATEVGVLFRPPVVYLYCRVEGGAYLTSRLAQVAVALAGVWVNLVVLLPFWAWWALDPDPGRRRIIVAGMVVGAAAGLVNLVPVPPADGYTALSAALGQPDLARDSNACVVATARALVRADRTAYPARRRAVYLAYAIVRALIAIAVVGAIVWYCLRILPPAAGTATLACALAFILTVSVIRIAGTRTEAPSKGTS
ncbi:MAG: M50 family metallopeptidase [Humibacillus sp.]|nr:M50 family metallopeptidase [Humibacillus sp.]MDN5775872.1 M50 family metallopeptidase [Humibacillus sp.]